MEATLDPNNRRQEDFGRMSSYLILLDQWLETPQVVLDGSGLLVLCGLIIIGGFALLKATGEGRKQ